MGETKDAPVYAAYSHEAVDLLVTSNTSDFPMDEQGVLTPAAFLERFEDA